VWSVFILAGRQYSVVHIYFFRFFSIDKLRMTNLGLLTLSARVDHSSRSRCFPRNPRAGAHGDRVTA
jgi:hypothetical protein